MPRLRIVKLRAERVALLGWSHGHWQMARFRGPGAPDRARTLLMQVRPAAVKRVRDEVAPNAGVGVEGRRPVAGSNPGTTRKHAERKFVQVTTTSTSRSWRHLRA